MKLFPNFTRHHLITHTYLTIPKTTRNSCCINIDHTGSEGAHVEILSYNIYQTLKLLVTHVVLTLASLDQKSVQLHLSVNVFTTKVLIVDTIFASPTGDGTTILPGHPSHAKVQPLAVQRDYLHLSVILRP